MTTFLYIPLSIAEPKSTLYRHFVSFLFLLIAEIASNFSLELKGWSWWNEHFLGWNSISHSNGSKTDPLKAKVTPHYSLWPLNALISDRSWTGQSQRPTLMNEWKLTMEQRWAVGRDRIEKAPNGTHPLYSSVQDSCHHKHDISPERTLPPLNTLFRKQADLKGRWQPALMKLVYNCNFFCLAISTPCQLSVD